MGLRPKPTKPRPQLSEPTQDEVKDEVKLAAMAWAEFLYDEYMLEKHKQLLLSHQDTTMEANMGNKGKQETMRGKL